MKFIINKKNNLKISSIGLGALHFGVFTNQYKSSKIIDCALDSGINYIDTAPLYGNGASEEILGNSIKGKRNKILICTKFGLKKVIRKNNFGVEVMKLNKNNLEKSLIDSLKKMQTDYIDIFQLHAFDKKTNLNETLSTLLDFKKRGMIRYIGISNYIPSEFQQIIDLCKEKKSQIDTMQFHYNFIERKAENTVLKQAKINDIIPIAYRGLARGVLSNKYLNGKIPLNSRAYKSNRVKSLLNQELINTLKKINYICKINNTSLLNFSLSWLIKQNCSAVIGVRSIKQLKESIHSLNLKITNSFYDDIEKCIYSSNYIDRIYQMPKVYFEK